MTEEVAASLTRAMALEMRAQGELIYYRTIRKALVKCIVEGKFKLTKDMLQFIYCEECAYYHNEGRNNN